jgi:hypothetical protein
MPDINLAQAHALSLALTLMVPVILFEMDGQYGAVPAAEIDGDEMYVLHEIDPFELGPVQ